MDTTQQLSDALFAEPDDFTLAAALVEHLVCDRDFWQTEADGKVEEIQRQGRDARNIARAANVVDAESTFRVPILGVLAAQCDLDPHRDYVVVVVGGDEPPHAQLVPADDSPDAELVAYITAPALLVLRIYRQLVPIVRRDHWTKARPKK